VSGGAAGGPPVNETAAGTAGGGERRSIGVLVEEGICALCLALLAAVPLADIVLRLTVKTGFPDAKNLLVHLLLVLGLVTGMITTRKREHLAIALAANFTTEKTKRILSVTGSLLSSFVITIVAWAALPFIRIGLMGWRVCGIIPDRVFALVIPLGYAVMAIRFARSCPLKGKLRFVSYLAPLLGTICALPVIGRALWPLELPPFFLSASEFFYTLAWHIKIPAMIVLVLAALAGTPLFVVMGGMALLLIETSLPPDMSWGGIDVAAGQVYMALTQDGILPIPLFTVAGFLLSESRAGERLVNAFRGIFGGFPGGMIIAVALICAFFTSFTGASGVTILALGGLLYSILRNHMKYPEPFSIGLLTSTGSIGLLFPPSLPVILVGATTMTSIPKLFAGGIIPGILLVGSVIIFGMAAAGKRGPEAAGSFSIRRALGGIGDSFFELLLPFLLLAGFFTGFFSITELGAVSVLYVFVVEVLVHRDIRVTDIPRVLRKAAPIIGGVLSIIALSMALSFYIIDTQAPQNLALWMRETIRSPVLFLLLLNLSLLVVGCLMDIFSAILIVLPLVSPLGAAYGIDPVHLGIIFITNLEVGFLTPPVGLNLFLASYRFEKPFTRICRYVLPFLLIQLAVVLLVTYVPALSTFLPRFF
jgi:tripartite ATP-independent transporter DctM subunit